MDAHPVSHPTDQTLSSYGLGKLDNDSADAVHKHLEQCPVCRNRVAELSPDSFLGRLRDAQGRPDSPARSVASLAGLSMLAGGSPSPAPPATSSLPPGLADHPDYEILRELGKGAMGVVYLAENKLMGRKEVLKVVGSHLINRRDVLDRFLAEIRNAARLHHPNIVTAYTALRMGESLVLAMEYVEGLDLAKLVKAHGPLPVANACYYVHQAALGLQHAHEHGMVHRDIKPGNLMRALQGNRAVVKVLDFGLAKMSREVPADGTLTYEGQMLGTPDFIAPEQSVDARKADIRADIYSLGCTLYYLLTGRPPFQGTSLYDVLQAHHSREALPLNLARPEVPVELAALVGKMMAKEPERRFQEPKEVAQALTPFFKKGTVASVGSKPDISQVGQPEAKQGKASAVSAPARPATEIAPAPAPAARRPSVPPRPGSILEGLIDLRETEPLFDPVSDTPLPVAAPRASRQNLRPWSTAFEKLSRSGPRAWWAAALVLLLGFVVASVVVLRVKTSNGMIELVNLPKDAEVLVDGEEVAVTWPGGGKPAVVTVTAGKHKIMVKKDGLEISGDEVAVQAEGREKFTVRFVPPTQRTHKLPKDDGQAPINNSIGMTLKLIPAGGFFMGSPDDAIEAENDEKPSHRVRISRPFYLGVTEVTQAQYEAVMGNNPSWFSANGGGKDRVAGQSTDRHPVEQVSWLDAIQFCNKLSEKEGKKPFYEIDGKDIRVPDWNGQGYRLPTEAEWEHACRANAATPTRFSFGDNVVELGLYAWFPGNSEQRTHPVSQKRPNGFGLYDMHGNVFEWCWDRYGGGYYNQSAVDDPIGPAGAASRVIRGGSWSSDPRGCRSAIRSWSTPGYRGISLGFCLARGQSGR
jgi:formylglycine-generating enzyme required for sulfatase activity/tRNA A-37 threonylcarbamoyl transferase component Bud32